MPTHALTIAPNHKAIERYYEELANYHAHYATYKQATRAAFEHLLSALASQVKWTLILEQRQPAQAGFASARRPTSGAV